MLNPALTLDSDTLGLAIPILIFLIPIIAILVRHQQKMAEIFHGGLNQQAQAEMQALRAEMMQMREMMHHQARVIEDLKGLPATQPTSTIPTTPRETLSNEPGLR
jgi:hypothetical protein